MSANLSEADLSQAFIQAVSMGQLSGLTCDSGPLIPEIDLMQGRPDFTCADVSQLEWSRTRKFDFANLLSRGSASAILSTLKRDAPRTLEFVAVNSGLRRYETRNVLEQLLEIGIVEQRQTNPNRAPTFVAPTAPEAELCIFELKVANWRRALFQALQYRAAAHRVSIVMPSTTIDRAARNADQFRRVGIGMYSLDTSTYALQAIVVPRKSKPLSRRHYYKALGRYLLAEIG